ncbi:MAG: GAF domain-containing protein [Acidobacteria bacterium]|nr:MAG: GAF domain-containing protein [Acidobacteriota bacterium]
MAEALKIFKTTDRKQIYEELIPQIESLVAGEKDIIANLANIAAAVKEALNFFWVGFYIKKDEHLVLGPFQGPVACTRIELDKGVCGYAYTNRKVMIVPDVDAFPGHIACSSLSRSEIVLPIFNSDGQVFGVLDVDSDKLNDFSEVDEFGLKQVVAIVEKLITP